MNYLTIAFVLIAITSCGRAASGPVAGPDKKVVCYFGSWAVYRPGNGKIDISNIDPTLCTHLVYTFIGLNADASIAILDPYADLPDNYGKDGYNKFNQLRNRNPQLKTIIALGGWNQGSTIYSQVLADPSLRSRFADNVVQFVTQRGFDGFDFDWEYPGQRGGVVADVENYVLTLKELSGKLHNVGKILSAAVGAAPSSASQSYNISEVSKQLDIINLMTYDFHGTWETFIGHNAPLYARKDEQPSVQSNLNIDAALNYWLEHGASAEKIVLGVPFYGHNFILQNPVNITPGAATVGPGPAGPYTQQGGIVGYNEICELYLPKTDVTQHWDDEQHVPFLTRGSEWVSYDNEKSIAEKVAYALSKKLGGIMVWSVETDDFRGVCGEANPLLKAINKSLKV